MRNKIRTYETLPCKMVRLLSAKGKMVSEAAIELRTVRLVQEGNSASPFFDVLEPAGYLTRHQF